MISPIYEPGQCVYVKWDAKHGVLNRVCIKKINTVVILPFDYNAFNYQDIDNRLWVEEELITLEQAQAIIEELES